MMTPKQLIALRAVMQTLDMYMATVETPPPPVGREISIVRRMLAQAWIEMTEAESAVQKAKEGGND